MICVTNLIIIWVRKDVWIIIIVTNMNTDKLTNTRYLAHGNVVTIDGKKYLCEQQ